MAESIKSALRDVAPVTFGLALADLIVAGWLVSDLPPSGRTFALYLFTAGVLFAVTVAFWVVFAAKHVWWERRRIAEEAARLAERSAGEWSQQHATDLLTCHGPCSNRYGCMVGVCVIAAANRMESQSPLESEKRT